MNPIHRYLYWNMNYHLEHHMFPLVPYHRLPKLHALVKDDCPMPYPNLLLLTGKSSPLSCVRSGIPLITSNVNCPSRSRAAKPETSPRRRAGRPGLD